MWFVALPKGESGLGRRWASWWCGKECGLWGWWDMKVRNEGSGAVTITITIALGSIFKSSSIAAERLSRNTQIAVSQVFNPARPAYQVSA